MRATPLYVTGCVLALASTAHAIELDIVWTGAVDGNWSTPGNWNLNQTPCNVGEVEYRVVIPGGSSVTCDVPGCQVTDLTQAGTLTLAAGTSLEVLRDASFSGTVNGVGGHLTAVAGVVDFAGCTTRVWGSNGSVIQIAATSMCTSGLGTTTTLVSADGAGTLVDLSSVTQLDDAFNDGTGGTSIHTICATNGGAVDLSSLAETIAAVRTEDILAFDLIGVDASIDLSSLETIGGVNGRTRCTVSEGATLSLPAIDTMHDTWFVVSGGSTASVAGPRAATWNTSGLPWSHTLASCTGAGTVIDLSAVTMLNGAFNDGSGGTSIHTISVVDGGAIDLSGLSETIAAARAEDILDIVVDGASSSIDLSALHTIGGANGRTRFTLLQAATLALPAMVNMSDTWFSVSGGSTVAVDGANDVTWNTSRLPWSHTLVACSGAGNVVDLSSVTVLNDAFNDGSGGTSVHTVSVADGGVVDLSGLAETIAAARTEDILEFVVDGATSSLDLSGLQTIGGAAGRTRFIAGNGASITLPAIDTMADTWFHVDGAATIAVAGAKNVTWNTSGLPWSHSLANCDGDGSTLDLSAVTLLDDSYDDGSGGASTHSINVSNGGHVDLSGLLQTVAAARAEDFLELFITGATSSLDVGALHTISGAGGRAQIRATDGATLDLPALTTIQDTWFNVSGGARVSVAGGAAATWDTSGLPWSHTLISCAGAGSVLDLSAVTMLDDSYNDGSGGASVHTISVTNGGSVDLPNLTTIELPVRTEDWLAIDVSGAGTTLELGALATIPTSGGRTSITIAEMATLSMPALESAGDVSISMSESGSLLETPALCSTTGSGIGATINDATWWTSTPYDVGGPLDVTLVGGVIDADTPFIVGSQVSVATTDARLDASMHVCVSHADEAGYAFGTSTLHLNGSGSEESPQRLEVGGLNLGLLCDLLNDENMGYGKLTVGSEGSPTVVSLRDVTDNGNSGGDNLEALYLFGADPLEIAAGSVLVINHLPVYLCDTDTALLDLFAEGVDEIPWGDGTIRLGIPAARGDVNGDGAASVDDLILILAAWGDCPCGTDCPEDVVCDGTIDVNDLLNVISSWSE